MLFLVCKNLLQCLSEALIGLPRLKWLKTVQIFWKSNQLNLYQAFKVVA